MSETTARMEHAVPFAMEPVVYDFAINERGTEAELLGGDALMPAGYYTACGAAAAAHRGAAAIAAAPRRARPLHRGLPDEVPEFSGHGAACCSTTCCRAARQKAGAARRVSKRCSKHTASTAMEHEQIQADLRSGRIGLAQNRLPASSRDHGRASPDDRPGCYARHCPTRYHEIGLEALAAGKVAVVTLAGGSRQPLDQGRGRGEGAQSVLQLGGGIAASSKCTWPRAAARARLAALRCPTSSPPAT